MNAETIKDFLVSLGFSVDDAGAKKFGSVLAGTTANVIKMGLAVEGAALSVVAFTAKIASGLDNLYWASQRTGATVQGIQSIGYAVSQVGGSVDAALNNFVALHYAARHMSWLHCFWGVGATAGPMILSLQLSHGASWRSAYGLISGIQFALAIALFLTLPVWRRAKAPAAESGEEQRYLTNREALRLPLVKTALVGFVFFCAVETTSGLWASTYLHQARGLSASEAAMGASMFYGAITAGRLVAGFAASRLSPARLIRIGQCVCLAGAAMVALPAPSIVGMLGIAVIGLGTSPIYPNMLHETPRRFGARNSQAIVGLEIAFAYIGSTLIPPLFGSLASATTLQLYPWFLAACTLVMLAASETVARRTRDRAV